MPRRGPLVLICVKSPRTRRGMLGASEPERKPMQLPVQVTYRGMESSAALEDAVREKAAKLEQFYPRLTRCRVVIEEGLAENDRIALVDPTRPADKPLAKEQQQ